MSNKALSPSVNKIPPAIDDAHEFAECLINTVREPVIVLDHELRVITVSRSFYDFFNVTPEETIGQLVYDLGNKQWDIPVLRELLGTILPQKTTFDNYEVEHDFTTIGKRIMLLNARQIPGAQEKEQIILLAIEDITESKRAAAALIESENKFHTLFETMSEGIVYEDHDGTIIAANPAAERLLGLSLDQLQGRTSLDPCWKAIHEDGSPFPGETHSLNVAAKTGKPTISEVMGIYNPKLNAYVWLSVNSTPEFLPGKKEPFRAYAVFRDITNRKKSEEALQESERKLCEAQKMAQLGYWNWDITTGNVEWSEEVFRIFRLDPREFTPRIDSILSFSPWPEDHGRDKELIRRAMESHEMGTYEQRFLRPDKSIGYYSSTFQGKYDATGKLVAIFGTVLDITERKAAERQLKSNYSLLEALVNSPRDLVIFSLDKEYRYTAFNVNHRKEMNLVWNAEIAIGDTILDYMNIPELRTAAIASMDRALHGETFTEIQHQPGLDIFYEITWNPVYLNGEITGVICFIRNITERKHAEAALKESEEKFRTIFENSAAALAIIEQDTTISMVNKEYCKLGHYTENDVVGTSWTKQIPPEDLDRLKEYNRKRLADPASAPDHYEFSFYRKDGTIRSCLMSVSVLPTSQKIVCSFVDITERKRTETAISEKEKEVSSILAKFNTSQTVSKIGTWELTIKSGKVWWSDELYRIFEVDPETFIPSVESNAKFVHPDDDEPYHKAAFKILETGEILDYVVRIITNTGKLKYCRSLASVMLDENRQPLQIVGTFSDITEYYLAEERIKHLNLDLIRKNSEMEQLLYVASHDLRSPLVNMQGFSKEIVLLANEIAAIASNARLPKKEQSRIAGIVSKELPETERYVFESIIKMDSLLKGLLKLSRFGRAPITLQKIDMNAMVNGVVRSMMFKAQQNSISIETTALPPCSGDPQQVDQIFSNLIDNAVKYIDPHRQGVVRISGTSHDGISEYCVEDNGIGIAKDHQAKVFEIFHRLNPQASEGEGLGLAIVKKAVSRLGGTVRLESELHKGSRFIVTLPDGA